MVLLYEFYRSSDIAKNFRVRMGFLEGGEEGKARAAYIRSRKVEEREGMKYLRQKEGLVDDVYCTCYLASNGGQELGLGARTSYQPRRDGYHVWNEWLQLPVKYSELPQDVQLVVTIWAVVGPRNEVAVGGTTLPLFTESRTLRKGRQKLVVWRGQPADASYPTDTPGKRRRGRGREPLLHVEKLKKRYDRGQMDHVDWLDDLAMEKLAEIREKIKSAQPDQVYLNVELPLFSHPVLFYEQPTELVEPAGKPVEHNELVTTMDQELGLENPAEIKHLKLARSQRLGLSDRTIRATTAEKRWIQEILNYPPNRPLTVKEKDFMWRFRYYLNGNKKALTKFLKCIDWSDRHQAKRTAVHIWNWEPIDVTDALELLTAYFRDAPQVRQYAVSRLATTNDDELASYLLQLVQALRYEFQLAELSAEKRAANRPSSNGVDSNGNGSDSGSGKKAGKKPASVGRKATRKATASSSRSTSEQMESIDINEIPVLAAADAPLTEFLVARAMKNPEELGSLFYWYLVVETEDNKYNKYQEHYKRLLQIFLERMAASDNKEWVKHYRDQEALIETLANLSMALSRSKASQEKKIERLKKMVGPGGEFDLMTLEGVPLPMNPTLRLYGVVPEKCHIFNSAKAPIRVTFRVRHSRGSCPKQDPDDDGTCTHTIIFKVGDDLRQDQLTLQLINLMDQLLQREHLDLKLTPYRVLATSWTEGMIECVDRSKALGPLFQRATIHSFLRDHHPDPYAEYGIQDSIMDTFVKSCAGYCVITYLLGIGDRHLDNVMLTTAGHMFHIDFGFILGRDPKPWPPPMKLCKEMVEGMGGYHSDCYIRFKEHCCEAFNILRKSVNLILNLFSLMLHSELTDIKFFGPEKSLLKLQEKFRLELSDQQASLYFQSLINESVSALFPQLTEVVHRWASYWRRI